MSNNSDLIKMFSMLQEAYLATIAKMDNPELLEEIQATPNAPRASAHNDAHEKEEESEMAHLPNAFNAHSVEPSSPSAQLPVSGPEGHPVVISESEFKPSKNNPNNGYLELLCTVIDGPAKGATGAYRLNLYHDNPQTVDIASRQLSAVCHVTGQMMITDSNQLHNIPFRVIVANQKPDPKNPDGPVYTEIKSVLDIHGNKPKAGQAPAQQAAPQPSFAPAPAPVAQYQAPAQQAPGEIRPPWAK